MSRKLARVVACIVALGGPASCDAPKNETAPKAKGDAAGGDKTAEKGDGPQADGKASAADAKAGVSGVPKQAADDAKADGGAAAKLLAEAVEAIGGRDKIEAIKSFHNVSKLEVQAQHLDATVEVWWKGGDFYVESEMPGVGTTRAWKKGDETWAEDPILGKRKLEGHEALQTAWSASLSLAADYDKYFDKAEVKGKRKDGHTELVDILLTAADGTEVTLSLDTATHLPLQQAFDQDSPMGKTPVTMHFEDYREIDGVKVPYRTRTSVSIVEAISTVEEWTVNVPVDESKFSPPA